MYCVPWVNLLMGERISDHHLPLVEKIGARGKS